MVRTDVNVMLIWIAVKGLSPEQALATLDLELSDDEKTCDAPGWPDFENPRLYADRIFMGQLQGSWLLLFGNLECEEIDRLAQLARFGPAFLGNISRVGCFAEGHSYANGQEAWSVDYDYDNRKTADALQVKGRLPPEMSAIVDQAYTDEAEGRAATSGSTRCSKYRARCPRRSAAFARTRNLRTDFAGRRSSGSVANQSRN